MNLFNYSKLNPKKKKIAFHFDDKTQNVKQAILENTDFYTGWPKMFVKNF